MTDRDAGDASPVEALLNEIDDPIGQFTADGAYDGNPTYDAVTKHSAGAAVVIPPRATAVERPDTDLSCQRDRHIAAINADGRMKWQAATDYGKRSRDRNRSLQVDRRASTEGTLVRRTTDGSCHGLCHPQSNAGMRTPEIRPVRDSYRIDTASKTEIRSFIDRCTNAARNAL